MEQDRLMLMLGEIKSDVKTLLSQGATHETRISKLEKWRYTIAGIAIAAGTIIPPVVAKAFGWH